MDNINLNSEDSVNSGGNYSTIYENSLSSSQAMRLFEDELKDIYWAEKALTPAFPAMRANSRNQELRDAISSHLEDTENQVNRIEQIFEDIAEQTGAQKCEVMEGLIKELEVIMLESDEGDMRDIGIISTAQKMEHYEIATYGILRLLAFTLALDDAVQLIQTTLNEEKAANLKLTEIAIKILDKENSHSN